MEILRAVEKEAGTRGNALVATIQHQPAQFLSKAVLKLATRGHVFLVRSRGGPVS